MGEQTDRIRQNTSALIIAECKKYIMKLKKDWERKTKLIERKGKTKANVTTKENTISVSLVHNCPLSASQRFCHSNCNWWDTVECMHPSSQNRRALENTKVAASPRRR